jgi:hypothetical protein
MDVFQGQLSFDDTLNIPLPLLHDLFNARYEYLQEKRKIENEYMASQEMKANSRNKKQHPY